MESELQKKISIGEKVGFACGDLASNLFFQTFMTFMPIFYTDIFGLKASTLIWMFLVSKIFDAVNDPIMGMVADRTETRWGKYRPYLLFGAIPFGIMGILTFTTPHFSYGYKVLYAFITYNAVMMLYTLVNVPYCSLMGVMTSNTADRTVLSSYRFVGVFIGQLIVMTAVTLLPGILGGDVDGKATAKGFQITMTILSVIAIVLLYITFFTAKERVHPPKGQRNPMRQDLVDLIRNVPWLMIGFATFFQLIFVAIQSSARTYYFKYYVNAGDVSLFYIFKPEGGWSSDGLLRTYLISGAILTIIGVIATKYISRIFGKAFTYWGFLAIGGITTALYYYLKPENLNLIFIVNFIRCFALGPVSAMQWAMFTDCADYNEWKTGRRSTALMMAASLFFLKFGLALGAAAIGWILDVYGYIGKTVVDGVEIPAPATQSAEAVHGILMLNSIYPAIFVLLGVAVMIAYPLSTKKMLEIETDLLARRKQEEKP
ncbi:MAG: MFS transporter [Sedimentisphaerales bacterium]|nr:MFS transporter [Sedimentisphaerales bacterium]